MDIYRHGIINIITILIAISDASSYEFSLKLQRSQEVCFKELTNKDIFIHISIESLTNNTPISISIREEDSKSFIYQSKKAEQKAESVFTTLYENNVIYCIKADANPVTAKIIFKAGPEARDYSMLAKNVHISTTENIINRVHNELALFHRSQVKASRAHDKSLKKAERSYNMLKRFFIFNCVIIIFSTIASAFYYKRFFTTKKII